jgi:hypothetical protein
LHGGAAERRAVASAATKLWKAWWLGGALLAALTALLVLATERAYSAGNVALGGLANMARVLVYMVWALAAWRCSRNVDHRFWTYAARVLLVTGLVASAVLY